MQEVFKQLRDESTAAHRHSVKKSPQLTKARESLLEQECIKVTVSDFHTVNSFRETGMHKIMCSFCSVLI